jgi:hypothetical protein
MNQKVSAIVCACNEQDTIKPILDVLIQHPKVDELIVIDDGSTDKTWTIISQIAHDKLKAIRHPTNQGKGAAVASGVRAAQGDVLLLIDADLKKFHPAHVDLLLIPLEIDPTSMTIGIREIHLPSEKPLGWLLKSFGGERALAKSQIMPLLKRIEKSGYGVEAILNLHFIRKRQKINYVPLPKLIHLLKEEKHPLYKFVAEYLSEGADIVKQYAKPETKALEAFFKKITSQLGV